MKKKPFYKSPVLYTVLALIAAALFLTAGIGSARAALTEFSQDHTSEVRLDDIGLTLLENGKEVAYRNYDKAKADGSWTTNNPGGLFSEVPDNIVFGKKYTEELSLQNTGTIDEFVRVEIYRYWLDKDGKKTNLLSPELIEVELNTEGGWIEDPDADSKTTERTILYYSSLLGAGETSAPFTKSVEISNKLAKEVSQKVEGNTIITTYKYDGVQFCVEVKADAVQNHNAADAIKSAWGIDASISGDTLSLN